MGSTRGGPPSLLQAMIGDSTKENHTASNGEGRIDLPSLIRHGTGASMSLATTIPWSKATPTTQAMMTILPRQAIPRHEPPLRQERILMIDYAPVQAQGKGEAPTTSHERGPSSDHGPERITSAYRQWGGQVVPPVEGDSHHRRHATSRVHSLTPVRLHP
jgi:hypothetical protein